MKRLMTVLMVLYGCVCKLSKPRGLLLEASYAKSCENQFKLEGSHSLFDNKCVQVC